jgi:hypothetical protein
VLRVDVEAREDAGEARGCAAEGDVGAGAERQVGEGLAGRGLGTEALRVGHELLGLAEGLAEARMAVQEVGDCAPLLGAEDRFALVGDVGELGPVPTRGGSEWGRRGGAGEGAEELDQVLLGNGLEDRPVGG